MSGWVLLIIGLASLAVVVGVATWVGLKGWRVAKHGMAVSRSTGALAADVAERAGRTELNVTELQNNVERLRANLARMQASAERLRILSEALAEALTPFHRMRAFFGR